MATKYWYGGTGLWNSGTSHWSYNSGNSPTSGATNPTASDDVIFDQNSATGSFRVGMNTAATPNNARNVTIVAQPATTGTITLSGANQNLYLLVYGNFAIQTPPSAVLFSHTNAPPIKFYSNSAVQTLSTNGTTMPTIYRTGATTAARGSLTLLDNYTGSVSSDIELEYGYFYSNGKTITCRDFDCGGGLNPLTAWITGSTLYCSRLFRAPSYTYGGPLYTDSSTIYVTGSFDGNDNYAGANGKYNDVYLYADSAGLLTFDGSTYNTYNNLYMYSSPTKYSYSTAQRSSYIYVTNTLGLSGYSTTSRLRYDHLFDSYVTTISANAISAQYVDFRGISADPNDNADWNLTHQVINSFGDCGLNSNITFTTATDHYATKSGNWSSTSMWSSSDGGTTGYTVPLPQDDIYFTTNSNNGTYTVNMPYLGHSLISTPTANESAKAYWTTGKEIYGNVSLSAKNLYASNTGLTFKNSTPATFYYVGQSTTNSFVGHIYIECYNSSVTLLTSLYLANHSLYLNDGTFDAGGFTSNIYNVESETSNNRTITITGATINGLCDFDLNSASNLTVNAGSSTINLTYSGLNRTFNGCGKTFGTLYIGKPSTSTYTTIDGSNTFDTLTIQAGADVRLTNSTTNTATTFNITGTSANKIWLHNSSAARTQATLAKAGGGTVSGDYIIMNNLIGSPADTFVIGPGGTNWGNNTNIKFDTVNNMILFAKMFGFR